MAISNVGFVEATNPHSWLLVADDLHSQAVALKATPSAEITRTNYESGSSKTWPLNNRSIFLLAGLSLENAIKSYLVYENPSWIADGRLANSLRSHRLTKLAAKSKLIPYRKRGLITLTSFEEGLESWARYPCGLHKGSEFEPSLLDDKLWRRYLRLSAAYGKKMRVLLAKPWKGPHGFHASFKMSQSFLSMEAS